MFLFHLEITRLAPGTICTFRMSVNPVLSLQIRCQRNINKMHHKYTKVHTGIWSGRGSSVCTEHAWPADLADSWLIRWVVVNNHLVSFIDLVRLQHCGFELRTWWRWSHHPHLQKELKTMSINSCAYSMEYALTVIPTQKEPNAPIQTLMHKHVTVQH